MSRVMDMSKWPGLCHVGTEKFRDLGGERGCGLVLAEPLPPQGGRDVWVPRQSQVFVPFSARIAENFWALKLTPPKVGHPSPPPLRGGPRRGGWMGPDPPSPQVLKIFL